MENFDYQFWFFVCLFLMVGFFLTAHEFLKERNIAREKVRYLEDLSDHFAHALVVSELKPFIEKAELDLLREYKKGVENAMFYPDRWDTEKFPTASSAVKTMYCLSRRMGAEYFKKEESDV